MGSPPPAAIIVPATRHRLRPRHYHHDLIDLTAAPGGVFACVRFGGTCVSFGFTRMSLSFTRVIFSYFRGFSRFFCIGLHVLLQMTETTASARNDGERSG